MYPYRRFSPAGTLQGASMSNTTSPSKEMVTVSSRLRTSKALLETPCVITFLKGAPKNFSLNGVGVGVTGLWGLQRGIIRRCDDGGPELGIQKDCIRLSGGGSLLSSRDSGRWCGRFGCILMLGLFDLVLIGLFILDGFLDGDGDGDSSLLGVFLV